MIGGKSGLRSPFLQHLPPDEKDRLRKELELHAEEGFQVWGIPSGARAVLRDFQVGDYLLLLEAAGPGGTFAYVGRAIGKPSRECFDLSGHLWGEQRFPLIIFLKGHLTDYRWPTFCGNVGYKENWNPAGQTYRIPHERLLTSPYGGEDGLIRALAGQPIPMEAKGVVSDRILQDLAELDIEDPEGLALLKLHLHRERSARIVAAFKSGLPRPVCCVCGFDFLKAYGELGRGFIEAHHTRPVADLETGAFVSTKDLAPVCSNCHRMLHRRYPVLSCEALKALVGKVFADRL